MKMQAVITGATSGIGFATAMLMVEAGITVIGVGRDINRCVSAKKQIVNAHPHAQVEFLVCDLSSQEQVRNIAKDIAARWNRLDILVNNAGSVSSHYRTSADGIELQLAVNHLAPFLLTHELLPLLHQSAQARVITTSYSSHYGAKLDFHDIMMRRHYSCLGQYRRMKLCNVLFTAELNRRLGHNATVRAFAVDPGLVNTEIGLKGTSGMERFFWKRRMKFGAPPEVPAGCILYLATNPDLSKNESVYWHNKRPKRANPYALREDIGRRLWDVSEKFCGVGPEKPKTDTGERDLLS